jgi:glucokinase
MSGSLLIGDVGPGNVVLAIVEGEGGSLRSVSEATFSSRGYPSLEEMIREFLRRNDRPLAAACFSVAGPVVDEQVWFPNLNWCVDQRRLRETLRLQSVVLVNDLQAIAMALPYLGPTQIATLQMGVQDEEGRRAVIATGMGLGEAVLISRGDGYDAHPSEGGHADFAPNGELQEDLLRALRHDHGHVSYERVCSGLGLPNLYRFLRARADSAEPAWLAEMLSTTDDPSPVIVAAGLGDTPRDPVCRQTLELFASILGAECGNLALRTLASGGVYVGGDLARRILPVLKGGGFLAAFRHKGPMTDLIRRIPVHVILEPRAALVGAAQYALASMPQAEPAQVSAA